MRMWKTAAVDCEAETQVCRGLCRHLFLVTTVAVLVMLISTIPSFGQNDSFQPTPTGANQNGFSQAFQSPFNADQGHYIYSVSPKGSPAPTKISVVDNPSVQTRGVFAPNVPPEVNENDPIFHRRIEKHKDQVQFFVPCQIDANVDFQAAGMPVIEFNGQVCSADGVCIPISGQKVTVKFAGFFERENQSADKTAQPAAGGDEQTLLGR